MSPRVTLADLERMIPSPFSEEEREDVEAGLTTIRKLLEEYGR